MVKRRGIMRGRLFRGPLAPRDRLRYVRDFLDWVYAKNRTAKYLQDEFWAWYCGVYPEQASREVPREWSQLLDDTKGWDWPGMQAKAREKIEQIFLPGPKPSYPVWISAERAPAIFTASDGKKYFAYETALGKDAKPDEYITAAIDGMLNNLSDLSVDVMGVCAECGRLFVRLRPTSSLYCSPACRHLAFLKKHGFKPPTKASGKGQGKRVKGRHDNPRR